MRAGACIARVRDDMEVLQCKERHMQACVYPPLQAAKEMLREAEARGVRLLLPCDVVVSHSLSEPVRVHIQQLTLSCCSEEAPCIPPGG